MNCLWTRWVIINDFLNGFAAIVTLTSDCLFIDLQILKHLFDWKLFNDFLTFLEEFEIIIVLDFDVEFVYRYFIHDNPLYDILIAVAVLHNFVMVLIKYCLLQIAFRIFEFPYQFWLNTLYLQFKCTFVICFLSADMLIRTDHIDNGFPIHRA
jgi:uncharacterized membrane protein